MDTVLLKRILSENTGLSDRIKGEIAYKNGLVKTVEHKVVDNEELQLHGVVKADGRSDICTTEMIINLKHKCVTETSCDCMEFYSNYFNYDIYFCPHLIATMYKYIELIDNKYKKEKASKLILNSYKTIMNPVKDKIKIEVMLSGEVNNIFTPYNIEFRIGTTKLYVLKDIREFLKCYKSKEELRYGYDFTFDINKQEFESCDEKLIEFIENMSAVDEAYGNGYGYGGSRIINMKTMKLPKDMLKMFLECIKEKTIKLNLDIIKDLKGENAYGKIIYSKIPLEFIIKKNDDDDVILNQLSEYPIPLNEKGDIFLYENNIYVPPKEQLKQYKPLYDYLGDKRAVKFGTEEKDRALATLIPVLGSISSDVKIHKEISANIIKEPLKVSFYLDKEKRDITLMLKLIYGENEGDYFNFNVENKIILRNSDEEDKIVSRIEALKFIANNNKFIYKGKDSDLFYFLQEGIKELTEIGEVYYSDRFKESKIHSTSSIRANISENSEGYLDFSFTIGDIPPEEIKNILAAFKDKRKFYKLRNDSFIDLREKQMGEFFKLLENLSVNEIEDNNIRVNKNKALYLDSTIEYRKMDFIEGRNVVRDISNKIKNIGDLDLSLPMNLNADLRGYQKIGYKWLKTLSYYEFGGILADEMGLGKTVQTITFLLSEEGKKSLIVAPTSLVYNWESEFQKFAPTMKVLIVHGNKEERDELLKYIDDYDVVITTYNLLRIDFDAYRNIKFDYFIIDEAQNIKNPFAQATEAVKEIKASVRFALTGTPIENSLIELWSIFDFIMPGYLLNRHLFQQKFMKNMSDKEVFSELNRLIKPFILRRCKKEVMSELPEKIEKKLLVDMTDGQKKVYASFATKLKENIEAHVTEGEFNKKQIEILAYITKLRQICLDPSIIMDNYTEGSGKIDALMETLNQSIEEGHKVLVFSQFTSVLKNIGSILVENNIDHYYLDGATKANKRLEMVESFNNGDIPVFLISLKAGGTGLNLTSADVVIHFDPWWNPAVEDQATDRAHRIGQKNIVEVIKLIAKGTIEEKILKLQNMKKEIIEKVMTGDLNNGNVLRGLSKEEVLELFNL